MQSKQPKKYRKLTFADAQAIRAAREQNPALSLADLAAKFGVTPMSVSRVVRGEVHRKERERKLTPHEVQTLRYLARTGTLAQEGLSKHFGISQGEVSRIVRGELYAHVPSSTEEQAQIAKTKAILKAADRALAQLMASIPVEDDGPARTRGNPFWQPLNSGQQP